MNWEKLIREHDVWTAHNFPNEHIKPPGESIMGVVEEMGELFHAHLKAGQGIRGDQLHHAEEAQDAIADMSIYLLGVMSAYKVTDPSWTPSWTDEQPRNATDCLMRLAFWVGKLANGYVLAGKTAGVDGRYCIGPIIYYLKCYCTMNPFLYGDEGETHWPYDELVEGTWESVSQRDWIKYPTDGVTA